jgi:hypothetical protein
MYAITGILHLHHRCAQQVLWLPVGIEKPFRRHLSRQHRPSRHMLPACNVVRIE